MCVRVCVCVYLCVCVLLFWPGLSLIFSGRPTESAGWMHCQSSYHPKPGLWLGSNSCGSIFQAPAQKNLQKTYYAAAHNIMSGSFASGIQCFQIFSNIAGVIGRCIIHCNSNE